MMKDIKLLITIHLYIFIQIHGGKCNGKEFPEVETFDVDEVYKIIDRVYENVPEDEG